MTIFIAPIGKKTDYVKGWLKEESRDVDTLWLLHSKKSPTFDFPKIAKKLEKEIVTAYPQITIKKKIIESALSEDPTIDAIHEIIKDEEDEDSSLIRNDFVVNITGGTNIVAAAAILAATFAGTRAHYVLMPQTGDPRGTKYVYELPIQPIGLAKLNQNQLDVLKIISESTYEIENTPKGQDSNKESGSITRSQLLEKLGWAKPVKGTNYPRREGSTRLSAITKKLLDAKLIDEIGYIEFYEDQNESKKTRVIYNDGYAKKIKNEKYVASWKLMQNKRETRYQITTSGKRKARDSFVFKI
jgi:hypothetical protein